MGLRTRLDGRSEENDRIQIKNPEGEVLAEIVLMGSSSSTLDIVTKEGLYIEKPNGWNTKQINIINTEA